MRARITWAVLAPLIADELASRIAELVPSAYGDCLDESLPNGWKIVPGDAAYSALVDHTPGSEGADEDIALQLSRDCAAPVYLLRFREDCEAVWTLRNGCVTEEVPVDPHHFADQLRCPLPGAPSPPVPTRSVIVVEGANPDEVAPALGLALPVDGPLHLQPTRRGTLLWNDQHSVAVLAIELSEALSGRVYALVTGPQSGRFACFVYQHGECIGEFELPSLARRWRVTLRRGLTTSGKRHLQPASPACSKCLSPCSE